LADIKGKYLKRIKRRNAIKVTIVITVFLAGVLIVFLSRERTMLLESETLHNFFDTNACLLEMKPFCISAHEYMQVQKRRMKVSKTQFCKELDTTSYADYEKK
jgi:hypothetical protein